MEGCSQSSCGWASTEATHGRPLQSCSCGSQACSMLLLCCRDARLNRTQGFYAMAFPLHQAHSPWSPSKVYGIGEAAHWMPHHEVGRFHQSPGKPCAKVLEDLMV